MGGQVIAWIESYLKDREQFVQIENTKSSVRQLLRGVPQGSVLGPLLYVLYTTPIADIIKSYTPNTNMVDHSVGARDESNGSEASEALMFCFDNASPEKSCFVVDLVLLFRPPYSFLCS